MNCYIRATVEKISSHFAHGRRNKMMRLLVSDDTGTMEILFFQASFYERSFHTEETYYFYGRVSRGKSGLLMAHPEFEKMSGPFEPSILPVYRTVKGISQKDLRKISRFALEQTDSAEETLPGWLIKKSRICSREAALRNIHFPADKMSFRTAKYRLVYEELFFLQTVFS